jgi:spore coat polysaccharide biosynthesis protein SpsF (cytidylyltransferase family)
MLADRVLAVIDLGSASSAIPGAAHESLRPSDFALRRLGSQTLLQRVIRRISEAELVDRIAVTGADIQPRIPTSGFVGAELIDLPDSMIGERLLAAADRMRADWVVYLPVTRPFVDPSLIDSLIIQARRLADCDYIGFHSSEVQWRRIQQLGLAAEVCHADALRRLRHQYRVLGSYCSDIALHELFESADGDFQLHFAPVPEGLDREDLRFSLESEVDWHHALMIEEAMPREQLHWRSIATLLEAHPQIRNDMLRGNHAPALET